MIGSRISAPLVLSSRERIEYTHPLSARYTKGEKREMVGRAVFSPSSSARRADAPGASSVSPRSRSTAASDATSSARTNRWNEIPEAFAAVSSEWRPSAPPGGTPWSTRAARSDRGCARGAAPPGPEHGARPLHHAHRHLDDVAPVASVGRVAGLADAPQADEAGGREDEVGRPHREEG